MSSQPTNVVVTAVIQLPTYSEEDLQNLNMPHKIIARNEHGDIVFGSGSYPEGYDFYRKSQKLLSSKTGIGAWVIEGCRAGVPITISLAESNPNVSINGIVGVRGTWTDSFTLTSHTLVLYPEGTTVTIDIGTSDCELLAIG
jgi:hypothetical protein